MSRLQKTRSALGRLGRGALIALILCLATIGLLHLTRGTAVRHVLGVTADGEPIGVDEPQFPQLVTLLTGAGLTSGTRVEIALNGDTFQRLWDDLRSAQQSITLQLYYGNQGRMARTLSDILCERAAAGVRVMLLYDAFGGSSIPTADVEALRKAGVQVEPFRPISFATLHLAQNRSHVRGIVVDGRIGWTGGFGIDDKWFGDGLTNGSWRETNVRFEGPAVRQMQAGFAAAWVEATGVLLTARLTSPRQEDGVRQAGLLYTSPSLGSTAAERFFAMSIAGARKTLYITNAYFAPEAAFVNLLADAAKRGVDVRILTGGGSTNVHIARYAGRGSYQRLLEAGVRVYEWKPTTLHPKTFVIDGQWSTIGSMNFDNRSMALNDEATLMVLDETIGAEMNQIFANDLRHADEITLDRFRHRSVFQRLLEFGARAVTRLL